MAVLFTACYSNKLLSQNSDPIIKTEKINIIKPYKPTLSDAFKISFPPKLELMAETTLAQITYKINTKELKNTYSPGILKPATMKTEPIAKLYRSYVKAGFGLYRTPVLEVYYNNLRSRTYSVGAFAKHNSSKGQINNSQFSNNEIGINSKKFFNKHTLSAEANYSRDVIHFYGLDPELKMYGFPQKQSFNNFSIQTDLADNFSQKAPFNYNVGLKYSYLFDAFNSKESMLSFNTQFKKHINTDTVITLDIYGDFGQYTYQNTNKFDNYFICVSPKHSIIRPKWKLNLGANMVTEQDTIDDFHFYPDVNLSYSFMENYMIMYGGIGGNSDRNSLRKFTTLNPYLTESLLILHTNNKLILFTGIKGAISSASTFDVSLTYKDIENLPLFVNDTLSPQKNKFKIIYDDGALLNFHAELGYQKSEKLKLLLSGDYNQFALVNELQQWHLPFMKLSLLATYNIDNKIFISSECFAVDKVYVPVYTPSLSAKKLNGFADLNFSFEYKYSKSFSVFLDLRNVLNKQYYLFDNYQTHGFSILGGLTYSF